MTMGKSITGVLVKQTDPKELDEVSLGYTKVNENFSILEDSSALSRFSRSVTVSKEAFMMAMSMNISEPFAAIFRFLNMSKDEYNSSVLDDEVIAVEMGAAIRNLTDTINLNFRNLNYKGIPSCRSWNGNGSQPTWSDDGCETLVTNVINVTCKCTHMTFFAVLLTPINETISSSDLNILTTITRVGCGISMFFLGIILFMHFIMRRARASNSTKILIHLVVAMFLLVFSFLVNDFVAQTKNVVGCTIMAASMHYFMLSTFTWFGVHAFHLSMQLHSQGKIHIQRYVLKVAVISWVLPSIVIIVLLSVGKYGEVTIQTENTATSPSICWILDNTAHYIVNIGYYALVFLFTFSTMVLILTWLYYMRKNQKAGMQGKNASSCQKIITITGLCCVLGVTWSCAFFAYGIFRVPALYCFTILNSFQGFCLFIYYYKTSHMVESKDPSSTSSTSTLKTNLDEIFNPYDNDGIKPKPE
ncbi:adhesion G-protein coupled receptor G2 [Periophthalmus magnuspinnatus]|uniref:adhesion G-protein coupled receptor G2 n=1 Tax=Periophthalmus magnuspinnatus TaxID=409849 RepID=UPI002436EC92|nr:adhesion G-protein coupled receptor G2 [Periophthalmus magnuspinnatus]